MPKDIGISEPFDKYSLKQDSHRFFVTQFVKNIANGVKASDRILDAGAGECVYGKYFARAKYWATDFCRGEGKWNYSNLDFYSDLRYIPIKDATFDKVLCTETLEHVSRPEAVLKELSRVLKREGTVYITVPFLTGLHQEPYDFYRYTQYGLKYLLEASGFIDIKITPHGGLFLFLYATLSVVGSYMPYGIRLSLRSILTFPLRIFMNICVFVLRFMFITMYKIEKPHTFTIGYQCVAVRR